MIVMLISFSGCIDKSTNNKEEKTNMNEKIRVENIPDPFLDYDNGLMEQMDKEGYIEFETFDGFKDFVNNNKIDNSYLHKFSEDYFKDNDLFITFKFTSSSIKHSIEGPVINKDSITIKINETLPNGKMTMDLKFRGYFISINKGYLKDKEVNIIYTKKDTD